jgi:hypothetical protein
MTHEKRINSPGNHLLRGERQTPGEDLGSENTTEIKDKIKQRFVKVALVPQAQQRHPTGPASAKKLGYDPAEIDGLPAVVTESFAGVGNPLGLGEVRAGDTVLDIGRGAGVDSILAARKVGASDRGAEEVVDSRVQVSPSHAGHAR